VRTELQPESYKFYALIANLRKSHILNIWALKPDFFASKPIPYITVSSALEIIFNVMRSINPRFTLLTYLLCLL